LSYDVLLELRHGAHCMENKLSCWCRRIKKAVSIRSGVHSQGPEFAKCCYEVLQGSTQAVQLPDDKVRSVNVLNGAFTAGKPEKAAVEDAYQKVGRKPTAQRLHKLQIIK
jgi:hypothetical protein